MSGQVRAHFQESFGQPASLVAWAPGRVNLIGEHTDYNEGFVLPLPLDTGTVVAARPRRDGVLRVVARRLGQARTWSVGHPPPVAASAWESYVHGCTLVLGAAGHAVQGADLLIDGDLPLGAGLSSSASLEVAVLRALTGLSGTTLGPEELARLGQRVETDVIGVRCGIMDQLAVAAAQDGSALLIDCRDLSVQPIRLPSSARVLVLDTGVPRTLAASAYNERRAECDSAVAALRRAGQRIGSLRDVTPDASALAQQVLPDVEYRRLRHVVSENARVLAAVAALRAGDLATTGALMTASHASLRSDYDVSGPELEQVVEIALATPGVLGARLTGAGFGGCAVALVAAGAAERAAATITAEYALRSGRAGRVWVAGAAARA